MKVMSAKIKQVAALLQQGQISASELCNRCLKRIQRIRDLNVYVTVTEKEALRQAEQSDHRAHSGSLLSLIDGIPVAFKDNFSTKGIQTACGSRMLLDYKPPYTATVVEKLLDKGAVMMGKVNLDEFAMGCGTVDSVHGPTKNPWTHRFAEQNYVGAKSSQNHSGLSVSLHTQNISTVPQPPGVDNDPHDWHIAGGSSGGSAVAVATGTVFGSLGSDTGGSVRNPAAYCGVIGLKPTYGLLSRHGLIPLVNSMDVPGILTRSVDDAVVMLNSLAGHDRLDSTTVQQAFTPVTLSEEPSVKNLHIGIPKEYHAPGTSPVVLEAWGRVADLLETAGARVSQVSLPHTLLSIVCYHALCCCEVASNMARYDGIQYGHRVQGKSSTEALYAASRHEGFGEVVRGRILAGNYFLLRENYDKYFSQAMKVRRLIAQDFRVVFESGVDLLLTPAVLSEAPKYSVFSQGSSRARSQEQDVFTQPVNMAGIPAVVVPTCLSEQGLPISLQLIGQSFQEQKLLDAAKWMEQELNFPTLDLSYLDDVI